MTTDTARARNGTPHQRHGVRNPMCDPPKHCVVAREGTPDGSDCINARRGGGGTRERRRESRDAARPAFCVDSLVDSRVQFSHHPSLLELTQRGGNEIPCRNLVV
jgi:hypothetical protein